MAPVTRTPIIVSALLAAALIAVPLSAAEGKTAQLTIKADQGKDTINRNIYGHFSEHLGTCIYGGYWVGPDSPIPNTRGIRNDVVQALRRSRSRCSAGRAGASPTSTTGRTASARARSGPPWSTRTGAA